MNASGQPAAGEEAAAHGPGWRSFWSDAYGPFPIENRAREHALVLIGLENSLLQRLVRLQAIESRLWRLVSARRGRAGQRAVRQIERERRRLGRELHTGVGQLLAAIRVQLEIISHHLPAPTPPVAEALQRISALAVDALDQVRALSRHLHPPEWQRLLLHDAVRQLWETSGIAQRFAGTFQAPPLPCDPEPEIKTLIYRATQEALSNIIRHAKATRVDLTLTYSAGRLRLTVQDDGVGFDPARALAARPEISAGIGLRSIREQSADLGGNLLVHSTPLGTTLEVTIPLEC